MDRVLFRKTFSMKFSGKGFSMEKIFHPEKKFEVKVFPEKRMENGKKFPWFFPENDGKPDGKPMKINGKPWKMKVFHGKYTFSMENTHFPGKIHFPWIFHGKLFSIRKIYFGKWFFPWKIFSIIFSGKAPYTKIATAIKDSRM